MEPMEPTYGGVRLVRLNFQGKPRGSHSLSAEETLAVATESFPRSLAPQNARGADFRALKLFAAGASWGFALAYNGGAVDDWDRPVLSARVALTSYRPRVPWALDLAILGELLEELPEGAPESMEAARATGAALERRTILAGRAGWAEALAGTPPSLLGQAAHALALCRDVVFVGPDTPAARRLLTLALAMVPPARLAGLRLCTACHDPEAEGREEVVLVGRAPAPPRRSLWARVTGRPGERVLIDLTGPAPAVRGSRAFAAAFSELLEAPPWPETDFLEQRERLLQCLEALLSGREKELLAWAGRELPEETARRLREFVRRAGG